MLVRGKGMNASKMKTATVDSSGGWWQQKKLSLQNPRSGNWLSMSYVHIATHQLCFGHVANCTLLHPVMTESKSPTTLKTNSPFGGGQFFFTVCTSYLLSLMVQNIGTHYVTSQSKSCSNSHQGGLPSHSSIICKQLLNMCHPSILCQWPCM